MKHTPVITFERATCTCGQLPGIWRRRPNEAIGAFTLRAHAIWEEHKTSTPEPVPLFDYRIPVSVSDDAQVSLF